MKLKFIVPTRVVHGLYRSRRAANFERVSSHFSIAMDGGIP